MPSKLAATRVAAVALASSVLLALPAVAEDDIIKPAPTPMPGAGPTVAAAQKFCGDTIATADELITRYSSAKNLKETYNSVDYVAYADDDKAPTVVYTFTVKGHPAHPAAVCRKQSVEGENIVLRMEIVCDGGKEPCDKLRNDFNVMNAKMQAAVDTKIKEGAGKN